MNLINTEYVLVKLFSLCILNKRHSHEKWRLKEEQKPFPIINNKRKTKPPLQGLWNLWIVEVPPWKWLLWWAGVLGVHLLWVSIQLLNIEGILKSLRAWWVKFIIAPESTTSKNMKVPHECFIWTLTVNGWLTFDESLLTAQMIIWAEGKIS